MRLGKILAATATAVLVMASAVGIAEAATVKIKITDSGGGTTFGSTSGADAASISGVVGGGLSTNALGVATESLSTGSLAATDITTSGSGQVLVSYTATGLSLSRLTNIGLRFSGDGDSLGSSLQLRAYIDDGNADYGMGTLVFDQTFNGPSPSPTGFDVVTAYGSTSLTSNPYSLTITALITHVGSQVTQFDVTLATAVPLPLAAPLFLTGLGIVGAGAVRRRRANADKGREPVVA